MQRSKMLVRHLPGIWAALALPLLTACESPVEAPRPVPDVRSWVVEAAAASLDRSGHFILAPPAAPGLKPITPSETAISLAQALLRLVTGPKAAPLFPGGISVRDQLELQRGGPIDFSTLVPARRILFAESPYAPVPDSIPAPVQKYLGPFFLVTFLDRSDPAVVIASSAYNTDLAIEGGRLVFPALRERLLVGSNSGSCRLRIADHPRARGRDCVEDDTDPRGSSPGSDCAQPFVLSALCPLASLPRASGAGAGR